METTAEDFRITLANIARTAQQLGALAAGVTLAYRHNGAGHAPYVYAIAADGSTDDSATRQASEFLPVFSYRYTRRESMAALEACERALYVATRVQLRAIEQAIAAAAPLVFCEAHNPKGTAPVAHVETADCVHPHYAR